MKYFIASFYLILVSVPAFSQTPPIQIEDYIDRLSSARSIGFNEAFVVLGTVIAIMTATTIGVYKLLRKVLHDSISDEIRESECYSNTILGGIYWGRSLPKYVSNQERKVLLSSAIAVTKHALSLCYKLDSKNQRKLPTHALLATNLAYYLMDLSLLMTDKADEDKLKQEAAQALESGKLQIESVVRSRFVGFDIEWYNLLESKLRVEYQVLSDNRQKEKILELLDALIKDTKIDPIWRAEIEEDWKRLRGREWENQSP